MIDNADFKFARFWPISGTQMGKIGHSESLLQYQHAICGYLMEARQMAWNAEKISQERVNSVLNAYADLRQNETIPVILQASYGVMDVCIRVLGEKGEIPTGLRDEANEYVNKIEQQLGVSQMNVMWPQINQLVKQTLVWLVLLLNKNKKCSKPTVAKEPVCE